MLRVKNYEIGLGIDLGAIQAYNKMHSGFHIGVGCGIGGMKAKKRRIGGMKQKWPCLLKRHDCSKEK